jgi:hypothetical protein
MKLLISILFVTLVIRSLLAQNEVNEFLRTSFHKIENEEDLNKILEHHLDTKNVVAESYIGAITVMKAQYPFSPIKKFKYFSEGTKLIENSISTKQLVENTYLRLIIQINTPRFLGYYENIQQDITFIEKHIDTCNLSIKWKITVLEQVILFEDDDYNYHLLKQKLANYKTK